MHWFPAYVGLGSNLDAPDERVREAAGALGQWPELRSLKLSRLYRSAPLGPVAQPDFCNAVAGLLTTLPAGELLARLRQLEVQLGRAPPRERWGPRRIDLDLLVYAQERSELPDLQLPHPGIAQRNFVLYPLAEIAPQLLVPGLGPLAGLLPAVSRDGLALWPDGSLSK